MEFQKYVPFDKNSREKFEKKKILCSFSLGKSNGKFELSFASFSLDFFLSSGNYILRIFILSNIKIRIKYFILMEYFLEINSDVK